eukprot:SAG11_NODE_9795_length_880_cov_0.921895_2_plen_158_part_00
MAGLAEKLVHEVLHGAHENPKEALVELVVKAELGEVVLAGDSGGLYGQKDIEAGGGSGGDSGGDARWNEGKFSANKAVEGDVGGGRREHWKMEKGKVLQRGGGAETLTLQYAGSPEAHERCDTTLSRGLPRHVLHRWMEVSYSRCPFHVLDCTHHRI